MPPRPKHALITGGSRGIGLSIAQLFAKKGYRCTLISRSEDSLKAAISSLQPLQQTQDSNPRSSHNYIAASISPAQTFWSTSASSPLTSHLPRPSATSNQSSRIDVLVNCAGISQSSIFLRTSEAEIENIIQTNLTSLMIGTKFLIRNGYLRASRSSEQGEETVHSPVVINISSLLGLRGGFGAVAYAASKAGVLGFTRALATEYASHKVRVNAVVPGYIETDMTKGLDLKELEGRIPLGRLGRGEEVAAAALFLAENEYAHNCVVNLDGGLSAA